MTEIVSCQMFTMFRTTSSLALLLVACTCTNSSADLAAGSATVPSIADQTIRIPSDSPLTMPPFNVPAVDIPISTPGSFSFTWDDEDAASGTANVSAFSASFTAALPPFGDYLLEAIGIGPGANYNGTMANISSDADGQLESAELTINTTFSLMFTDPLLGGLTLYTKDTSHFVGTVVSGPAGIGEVYADPNRPDDATDVYTMLPNPSNPTELVEVLVGQSLNRIVTAVPEPASLVLLLAALGVVSRFRRNLRHG